VDPATKENRETTFLPMDKGGVPMTLWDKAGGIFYQKRQGMHEKEGWNTLEISVRGDRSVHLLNGQVVNACKNIRLVDPKDPTRSTPIKRGRIALEIEAAELFYRDVEIREFPTAD